MDVSLAIMAHPRRETLVSDHLIPALDQEPAVVWDRRNDRWDTGKRALQAHEGSDYHIVIQDDALVSPGLVAGVHAMLAVLPAGVPIGLYYGSAKPRRPHHRRLFMAVKEQGARWIALTDSPMWGVGLVLPTSHIAEIVEFGDAMTSTNNYDTRVARYYCQCVEQWYPIPSPVDHRVEGNSLVPGRGNHNRVAHEFLGDTSPADIDWHAPVVRQPSKTRPPTLIEEGKAQPEGLTPKQSRRESRRARRVPPSQR